MNKKIKVLVVDDSLLFREVLSRGISSDPGIEVVAVASDPYDARDKIIKFEPDVMTCDIEMPKMNGIEFIKRLLPQYSIPILVISSLSDTVFDAINAGVIDFVNKPNIQSVKDVEEFIKDVIYKIKTAANAKVIIGRKGAEDKRAEVKIKQQSKGIIAIGASTGGTEAIFQVLKQLPSNIPGIVIVQHIPDRFSRMFAERLNNALDLKVKEAETGDYLEQGKVLIAPGDQHMRVKKLGGRYKVECFRGERVNGHCPSVDILFESVAKEAGSDAVGIILTGMGYDGAKGLLAMKRKGAKTIGQDEATSVVYGMPKVAYDIGAVEKQVPIGSIAKVLYSLLS